MKNFKISYQRYSRLNGTIYDQTVTIDWETMETIEKAIKKEIKNEHRNHKKYATSRITAQIFLKTPTHEAGKNKSWIWYTTHTERNFANTILKLKLKDRNTRFLIK